MTSLTASWMAVLADLPMRQSKVKSAPMVTLGGRAAACRATGKAAQRQSNWRSVPVLVLEEEDEDQDDAISFSTPAPLKAQAQGKKQKVMVRVRAYGCRLSRPLAPIRTWQRRRQKDTILGKKERKEQASTDVDGTKENLGECPAGRHQ